MIETRRNIRSFKNQTISNNILNEILSAGLWAPSGCNRQTIEYLVLESKEDIRYCQRITVEGHDFPQDASVAVVVLADPRNYAFPSQRHMAYWEAGAAIQNRLLMAHCLGVGSCWLFWNGAKARQNEFIDKYNLKSWLLPVSLVCFGYSDINPRFSSSRKSLSSVIHRPH